ncbi:MAG: lysophospholipid acyltransferase family protein [Acidobacteriota bacterium]|nr:acyltransferase family protein [Blastocatellia bacterium]MDW8239633.1 lysophospholipid acyltransferase family protein [Acidobacteriota bacterium]
MAEAPKVINMKRRHNKAAVKARQMGAPPASRLETVTPPSWDSVIDARIQERFAAFEKRLEQSLDGLQARLEQALASSGRRETGWQDGPWASVFSLLEGVGTTTELLSTIREAGALVIDRLQDLGFVTVLAETITNVATHVPSDVDEFGYDQEFEDKLRPLVEFLYYKWWRVEMTGVEHIPDYGRVLLVSNHSGTLPFDGAMIKFGIRELHPAHRIARILMHDLFNSFPVIGPILCKAGAVRACHENGEKLLRRDHLTMVFPEGAKGTGKYFKNRYKLERFGRGGFVQLAARCQAPIVPVCVVGAEEIYPILENWTVVAKLFNLPYFPITPTFPWLGLLGLIPLPSKWYIDIGEPIRYDHLSPEDLNDDFLMDNLGNEVRQQIQQMIHNRLKQRRSVWRG